jgi:hypothetical protein
MRTRHRQAFFLALASSRCYTPPRDVLPSVWPHGVGTQSYCRFEASHVVVIIGIAGALACARPARSATGKAAMDFALSLRP